MRIAITGANGFVGQALCPYIAQHMNADVITIVRKPGQHEDNRLNLTQSDAELINHLIDVDCLIHLASRAHTNQSTALDFTRDNIELSERIGKICVAAKIPRLIYISSIKANGNSTTKRSPYHPDEIPQPEDDYGKSKLAAEKQLQNITDGTNTNLVIIRPPLVYGDKNKGNLYTLTRLIKSGIPLPFASLKNKRDLVSLENLCSLIVTTIVHPKASNQIFFVSDGISRSTKEIVNLLCKYEHLRCKQFGIPQFFFNILKFIKPLASAIESITGDLQVDITKTTTLLDWHPKV